MRKNILNQIKEKIENGISEEELQKFLDDNNIKWENTRYRVYDYEGHPYMSSFEFKNNDKNYYVYGNNVNMSDGIYLTKEENDVIEEYKDSIIYGLGEWKDRLSDNFLIIDDEVLKEDLIEAMTTSAGSGLSITNSSRVFDMSNEEEIEKYHKLTRNELETKKPKSRSLVQDNPEADEIIDSINQSKDVVNPHIAKKSKFDRE